MGFEPDSEHTVPNDPARLRKVESSRPPFDRACKCANVRARDDSQDDSASPDKSYRAQLVAALTDAISVAVAAGDLHVARVAHEALGRLLEEPEPGKSSVADLNVERAKRVKP